MGKCPFLFICMRNTFLYIPSPPFSPQRGRSGGTFQLQAKRTPADGQVSLYIYLYAPYVPLHPLPPPFRRSGDEPGELSSYKQKGHLLMGKCPFIFICMLHTFLYIPSPLLFAAAGTNRGNFPATSKKDTYRWASVPFHLSVCSIRSSASPPPSFSPQRGRTGERGKPSPQMSCCCKR